MAFSVQMPALGESVTEGTVTRWLKQEGDTVEIDEPLLEVSTDKVDTEIPSPAAGVLTKIVAHEDDTVEIGGELAVIGDATEGTQGGAEPPPAQAAPEPQPEPQATSAPEPEPQAPAAPAASAPSASGDSQPVLMPELGESVTEGTVTRWLKKVGDAVDVDEPLVEVSTDKVDTEIPSPVAGTLISITAEEDVTVSVGGELAGRIGARRATLEQLAWSGACDEIVGEVGRRTALWQLGLAAPGERVADGTQLALPLQESPPPRLRSLGRWQRLIADYSTSGVTVGDHAMAILRKKMKRLML